MTTFDDFNLKDNLLRGIYSYGFENPSDIQCKALPIINAKKDLFAARSDYAKSRHTHVILQLELDKVIGDLSETSLTRIEQML